MSTFLSKDVLAGLKAAQKTDLKKKLFLNQNLNLKIKDVIILYTES